VTSLRFPPVSEAASGMPCPSVIRWCLEPARARSTGLGPVLCRPSEPARETRRSPPWTNPKRPLHAVQPAGTRADAARPRRRSTQTPPARHPGTKAQLLGQEFPRNPGVEHKQDPGQDLAVIQALTARVIGTARHDRQQRFDPRPQPIRHDPRRLLPLPHMEINRKRSPLFQDHSVRIPNCTAARDPP
jgi:hypothetical protein